VEKKDSELKSVKGEELIFTMENRGKKKQGNKRSLGRRGLGRGISAKTEVINLFPVWGANCTREAALETSLLAGWSDHSTRSGGVKDYRVGTVVEGGGCVGGLGILLRKTVAKNQKKTRKL